MNKCNLLSIIITGLAVLSASAQSILVEPDYFPERVSLFDAVPQLRLYCAGANNLSNFPVVAVSSTFPYQPPTGTNVFGHAGGVNFFDTNRRMRMDFANPVSSVSIAFQSGDTSGGQGRLEVYDRYGNLLDTYLTAILLGGGIETMIITRPSADIAWAVAYENPGQGAFARLDNLVFTVPEPTSFLLLALGLAGGWCFLSKQSGRKPDSRHIG